MKRLLSPAEVVLAGPPNAGKSTLANALVGRAVSIVHETPGTTRDWVRELATLNGLPVWVTDTAGLWGGDAPCGDATPFLAARNGVVSPLLSDARHREEVESQSARRAVERIARADVVLLLGQPPEDLPATGAGGAKVIPVWTKSDLRPAGDKPPPGGTIAVSAHTGDGMDLLRSAILRAIGLDELDPAVPRAFTERQATLLLSAAEAIERDDPAGAAALLRRLMEGS